MKDQILVFKNGERVITKLQEVFEGEGETRRGVCLLMSDPYILELVEVSNPDNPTQDLQVKFSKWNPFCIDRQFRIPYDTVLAIGEADPGLAQAYSAKVEVIESREAELTTPPQAPVDGTPNADQQRADIEAAIKGLGVTTEVDSSVGA
jgi:hypothetical protein